MKLDHDFELTHDSPEIPANLIGRLRKLWRTLEKVDVKVKRGTKHPAKFNGLRLEHDREGTPSADVDTIAETIVQMALAEAETHEQVADHYEAMCWVRKPGASKASPLTIRFRVTALGDVDVEPEVSEIRQALSVVVDALNSVSDQNKELHTTLLSLAEVVRTSSQPLSDTMKSMGDIVAKAFDMYARAIEAMAEGKQSEAEIELKKEQWREGMGLLKEFLPEAVKQFVENKLGLGGDDDDEDEDDEEESATDGEPKSSDAQGKDGAAAGTPASESSGKAKAQARPKSSSSAKKKMAPAIVALGQSLERRALKVRAALSDVPAMQDLWDQLMEIEPHEHERGAKLVREMQSTLMENKQIGAQLKKIFTNDEKKLLASIVMTARLFVKEK